MHEKFLLKVRISVSKENILLEFDSHLKKMENFLQTRSSTSKDANITPIWGKNQPKSTAFYCKAYGCSRLQSKCSVQVNVTIIYLKQFLQETASIVKRDVEHSDKAFEFDEDGKDSASSLFFTTKPQKLAWLLRRLADVAEEYDR